MDLITLLFLCSICTSAYIQRKREKEKKPRFQSLGEALIHYRTQEQLSKEDVAQMTGLTVESITDWETNQKEPNKSDLLALCVVYKVTLRKLTSLK